MKPKILLIAQTTKDVGTYESWVEALGQPQKPTTIVLFEATDDAPLNDTVFCECKGKSPITEKCRLILKGDGSQGSLTTRQQQLTAVR